MRWNDAKTVALDRLAQLPLPPGDLNGLTVQLYEYSDPKLLRFEQGITADLEDHKQILLMMRRLLRKRKAHVEIIPVTVDTFLQWNTITRSNNPE